MLVLVTISLPLSLPPAFCRDSRDRATNNNSRVPHSPVLVDVVHKLPVEATSIVPEDVTMTRVLEVPVLWMTPMLAG